MARTLIVLRHGKSDWPEGVADAERPLAARGRRDAPAAGRWLRKHGRVPDLAVVSPAKRARQTWELVAAELGAEPEVRVDERVYAAAPQELIDVAAGTDDAVGTLVLVGHNPGMERFVDLLARGDEPALETLREKFPTCGIAVLEVDGPWAGLAPGGGRLVEVAAPRG